MSDSLSFLLMSSPAEAAPPTSYRRQAASPDTPVPCSADALDPGKRSRTEVTDTAPQGIARGAGPQRAHYGLSDLFVVLVCGALSAGTVLYLIQTFLQVAAALNAGVP